MTLAAVEIPLNKLPGRIQKTASPITPVRPSRPLDKRNSVSPLEEVKQTFGDGTFSSGDVRHVGSPRRRRAHKFIGTLLERRREQSLLIKRPVTFAAPITAEIYLPDRHISPSRSPSCRLGPGERGRDAPGRGFKLLIITNLTQRTVKGRHRSSAFPRPLLSCCARTPHV